jgi:anti-anti-sigma factor
MPHSPVGVALDAILTLAMPSTESGERDRARLAGTRLDVCRARTLETDQHQGERRPGHSGPVAFDGHFGTVSGAALSDHAASNGNLRTMIVRRRDSGDRAVLAVAGEVDLATAPALRSAIDEALDSGAGELWLDLCATTFMDSSGLHALFDGQARARELRRGLAIICPPGPVRRLFEVTGYAERIPLYDELAA